MNCEINIANNVLLNLSEDERTQLKDGMNFVYTHILLRSANTVLGKNINYNRDIIKTVNINNVIYYIHPILSKRGIDTVFKVSIQITRKSAISQPIIYFKGEYNSILNFGEDIEQLSNNIQNPKADIPVKPDEPKDDEKSAEPEPEEPKDELKEEPVEPTSNSSTDGSSDESEDEKTEPVLTSTPLATPYKSTLHNVGVEFPSDKKTKNKLNNHSLFGHRKNKSKKKNK